MISIIPIFFVNNINSSCIFRRGWYNDSVSSGGGTVYTTDLKSVGASLTSSNLVWRIWVGSSVEEQCPFKALVVGSNPTRPISRFIESLYHAIESFRKDFCWWVVFFHLLWWMYELQRCTKYRACCN